MPSDSVATLLDVLRGNQLLQPQQLDELAAALPSRCRNARDLALELVRRHWLTVHQVDDLLRNQVIGPYRILERLGNGGASQVFKAWDKRRNAPVALKVLRPELLSNPEIVGRFRRELRLTAHLSHPNIVKTLDTHLDGDLHYFAMEYVEGTTLEALVERSGPLPVAEACDYARQAAVGLQHAHESGFVHRDIKPANLLLAKDGLVKILDLGLARLQHPTAAQLSARSLTPKGVVIGTVDYLAPEQARNAKTADSRADLYSLGCTFYFLLTARVPFAAKSLMQKLMLHMQAEPAPVASVRRDVPPAVAAILQRMMAKQPKDRYQTAGEVATALEPYCGDRRAASGAVSARSS
jgi:serine/threonine-protein kinase